MANDFDPTGDPFAQILQSALAGGTEEETATDPSQAFIETFLGAQQPFNPNFDPGPVGGVAQILQPLLLAKMAEKRAGKVSKQKAALNALKLVEKKLDIQKKAKELNQKVPTGKAFEATIDGEVVNVIRDPVTGKVTKMEALGGAGEEGILKPYITEIGDRKRLISIDKRTNEIVMDQDLGPAGPGILGKVSIDPDTGVFRQTDVVTMRKAHDKLSQAGLARMTINRARELISDEDVALGARGTITKLTNFTKGTIMEFIRPEVESSPKKHKNFSYQKWFNTKQPQADLLLNTLAYMWVRVVQPSGDRVSNQDMDTAREALQFEGRGAEKFSVLSALNAFEGIVEDVEFQSKKTLGIEDPRGDATAQQRARAAQLDASFRKHFPQFDDSMIADLVAAALATPGQ